MNELKIRKALDDVIETISMATSWPDREFTASDSGAYIEVFQLPNVPIGYSWGADELAQGVYRIGLVVQPNTGRDEALTLAQSIAAHFPYPSKIFYTGGHLEINKPTAIGAPIIDTDRQKTIYPITVRYQDFH